jgi:hypothetical protein
MAEDPAAGVHCEEVTDRRNITQSKHPRGFLGYRTCKWSDF